MKNKIVGIVFAIVLAVGITVPVHAEGEQEVMEEYSEELTDEAAERKIELETDENGSLDQAHSASGRCGENVYWSYDEASKTVTIYGAGEMKFDDYKGYIKWPTDIEAAIIKEGVTSVAGFAFGLCGNLSSVSIADSVTYIGDNAFDSCKKLKKIKLPPKLEYIGFFAFRDCGLESIDIPGTVKELDTVVLSESLKEVTLHPGLEKIKTPFLWCHDLKTIVLPNTVKEINGFTEQGMSNMDIYIPASVTQMAYNCFKSYGSAKAKDIRIHAPKGSTAYEYVMKNEANEDIKWIEWNPTPSQDIPYNDISSNSWYYNAVKYVYDNKIMSGTSVNTFAPDLSTTREMMVTIVYNAAGKPTANYNGKFADVPNGKWFSTAVSWAVNNGITSGKSDNMFGVGENVTREQVAVFLYNFAKNQGKDVSAQADLSKYGDAASVSSWAKTAMSWANAKGVINGSNGKLNPKGNATRAEIAQMIMSYRQKI